MKALVEEIRHRKDCEMVAVIANRADSAGLEWAQSQGLATELLSHRDFASRAEFDQALRVQIDNYQPDLVLLAGFMRILTDEFVNHFLGRLINIHPSVLPAFPGLDTHQRAIDEGCKVHGCTVHFVTPELDAGPAICQSIVPVLPQDTADKLAQRVLETEHRVYVAALHYLVEAACSLQHNKIQWHRDVPALFAHPLLDDKRYCASLN